MEAVNVTHTYSVITHNITERNFTAWKIQNIKLTLLPYAMKMHRDRCTCHNDDSFCNRLSFWLPEPSKQKGINLLFTLHVTSPPSILVSYNHILRFPPSKIQCLITKDTRAVGWWNCWKRKGKRFCDVRLDIRRRCWLLIGPVPIATALLCPYIVQYSVQLETNLSQIQHYEDPVLLGCDAVLLG